MSKDTGKSQAFDPARLKSGHAQFVALLQPWDSRSVVGRAIHALFTVGDDTTKMQTLQPWSLLTLILWTVRDGPPTGQRPEIPLTQFHELLDHLWHMEDDMRLPSDYAHVTLFLRQLAVRQFWLQHGVDAHAIARQQILFGDLPTNHQFKTRFQEQFGLPLAEALELCFAVAAMFLHDRRHVLLQDFERLNPGVSTASQQRFLDNLSRDFHELRAELTKDLSATLEIEEQIQHRSPLLRTPFIRDDKLYIAFSPTLLYHVLASLAYRTLKSSDPEWFCGKFGPIFEDYLAAGLVEAGVPYLREADLSRALADNGRVVDFLVNDDDITVLIDAKSVELSLRGQLTHRPEVVFQTIKASAWKGIEQGMATAARLPTAKLPAGYSISTPGKTYLLIVTYDALFLGSGQNFENAIAREAASRLRQQYGGSLPIPFEHIFFLTVDEFDRLLERIRTGRLRWKTILEQARDSNRAHQTSKFMFIQHLAAFGDDQSRPPRLERALHQLIAGLEKKLTRPGPDQ